MCHRVVTTTQNLSAISHWQVLSMTAKRSLLPELCAAPAEWARMICYVALRVECGRMMYDSLSCTDPRSYFTIARETIIPWPQKQRHSYQQCLGEENTIVRTSSHNNFVTLLDFHFITGAKVVENLQEMTDNPFGWAHVLYRNWMQLFKINIIQYNQIFMHFFCTAFHFV